MTITGTAPDKGNPREHCSRLLFEADDWHDGPDLADLLKCAETSEGMQRLITEARLHNQGKSRWNGLLVPSKN